MGDWIRVSFCSVLVLYSQEQASAIFMLLGQLVPAFAKFEVQSSTRSWEVLAAPRSGNREMLPLKEVECC